MPYQGGRYLPPIATPIQSTYQKDFINQPVNPPNSFKYRSTSSLPPINYSNYRIVNKATKYSDEFQGTFGPAAPSAKFSFSSTFPFFFRPPPYDYPSKDPIEISTYRANFRESNYPRQGPHPTSPLRKNNPHPRTMTNAFNYPKRVSLIFGFKQLA
ncbi:uncharacterized protein LOC110057673 [Orbicella faveolata]|uniref:uncharacterized protein LOC110057673 n=1 Tax=Orbicella faveolata TaxID=48498 RepID=UPI0009E31A55|nr:uncharacterized protein LOC110057673 [Orbicella faveolata]